MYVILYKTNLGAFLSVKDIRHSTRIGGETKKYILTNTKQYKTMKGATMVANQMLQLYYGAIVETKVFSFQDFIRYLDRLTCKCGCDMTIMPIGGGCYNIPKVGIITPKCYERIVPICYQGTILAVEQIQQYVSVQK